MVPSWIRSTRRPSRSGVIGECARSRPARLSAPNSSVRSQLATSFGSRARGAAAPAAAPLPSAVRSGRAPPRSSRPRPSPRPAPRRRRRTGRYRAHEARLLGVRQLGQRPLDRRDERLVELERQQVGVGEIAVVVRLLLGAHRARLAALRIEQAGLLLDGAARLEQLDLAARLVLDRAADEAHRVQVLDLAARAERVARAAHRDVGVAAQVALLHVAIARAEVAQDRAQLAHDGDRLLGRADVRLGHDLHQRHARAVEVDQRRVGALIVQALAGVHLDVQAGDADRPWPCRRGGRSMSLPLPTKGCAYCEI